MSNLRQNLVDHFSEDELRALCFDLHIVYDSLPGSGTAAKALALIHHFDNTHDLPRLLTYLRQSRPHIAWDYDPQERGILEAEIRRSERPHVDIRSMQARDNATIIVGDRNTTTIHKGLGRGALLGLIGVVAALVAGSAGVIIRSLSPAPTPTRPVKMDGEFRIAVAQFGELDTTGSAIKSDHGATLSEWFFDRLIVMSNTLDVRAQIWHDKLNMGRPIGFIEGSTDAQRAEYARSTAQALNANLIIYGNLDPVHNASQVGFVPVFSVVTPWDDRDIAGNYKLGSPITVTQVFTGNSDFLRLINDRLIGRANAVELLANGLFYELNNQPLRAISYYSAATQLADWDDADGKDVAWLFLGRAYAAADQELNAVHAYSMSLTINPLYARPHIGLGNVYFQRAQVLTPTAQRLDTNDIDLAIDHYTRAINLSATEARTDTIAKAHISLARADLIKAEAYMARAFDQTNESLEEEALQSYEAADQLLDQSLAETDTARPLVHDKVRDLLADVEFTAGSIYQQKAHIRLAAGYTQEGITLLTESQKAYDTCMKWAQSESSYLRIQDIAEHRCRPQAQHVASRLAALQPVPRIEPSPVSSPVN